MTAVASRAVLFVSLLFALSAPVAAQADPGHWKGSADAPIEIVEYGDFACASCGQFARETLPHIEAAWIDTGRARLRFVPFNLSFFRPGGAAARAAECAARQDAFWPMHDRLYARQDEWLGRGGQRERLEGYARELDLDGAAFRACLDDDAVAATIDANTEAAQAMGVRATPTFVVNGRRIEGALDVTDFTAILEAAAGAPRQR